MTTRSFRNAVAALLALAFVPLTAAPAWAVISGVMPTRVAVPGATVDLPITVSQSLATQNVLAIQLRVVLDPNIVSASWLATGLVQTWGAPFTNVTSTFAALATSGTTPIATTNTDLATLRVTVSAATPLGTDIPLHLSIFQLNGGVPATAVIDGLIRVRSATDAPPLAITGLALLDPAPSPVRGRARFAFALPAGARPGIGARLSIVDVRGRLVRTLAEGVSGAGHHEVTWDAADASGRRVAPGLYFATLEWNGTRLTRRVPVLR
ncbi:MAG TPA: FlgD immunoglobulin-like domain containing protein [Candidatus Saccharimonadaceae bacterium]|jgi:hypothetical protein|nr:FlgD immunoglobulin-like domain containing protein [Candidatus Saccharimonadaceae bacterium]